MSRKEISLQEGAVIVADAHFSPQRPELLEFLTALERGEVHAPQLILMGDIFDLLFGGIPVTQQRNRKAIDLINRMATRTEVVYLEGNHDFQLASIFPLVHVIPLRSQPLLCRFGEKRVMLAHGDFGTEPGYRLYTALIRSAPVLWFLNTLNTLLGNRIIGWLDAYLAKKDDCNVFEGFEAYVKERLKRVDLSGVDYFIEGHYHQNTGFQTGKIRYFNLAAFACNQRYFVVESKEKEVLYEVIFDKES